MFHRVISRAWMNCNLTIFSRWIMISLLWVFTLSSTFTWYYLLNSKNILTLDPYLSKQVKYGKGKRCLVLNLFTSNERAKLNILETIPDSILLKGEWPRVSCEKEKKQTNRKKSKTKCCQNHYFRCTEKIFGRKFMWTIYAKKATSPFVRKYSLYGEKLTTMISSTRVK